MRGYKALKMDMSAKYGDMTYEFGKEYILEGELELCKKGYHFCKDIMDAFVFYEAGNCRIFEVDTLDGKILAYYDKCCSDKIKLVREITTDEIKHHIETHLDTLISDSSRWEHKISVAAYGYGLDKLVNDKDVCVRAAVARQGYALDKLVNDENWSVRLEVAEQGYGLDILIDDQSSAIRAIVAEHGYGLDKLVNDSSWYVRLAVAKQGYGLDKLVDDDDADVRLEVAEHGYGLDKLVNDTNLYVREAVARQGYGSDKLVNDEDLRVSFEAEHSSLIKSKLGILNNKEDK